MSQQPTEKIVLKGRTAVDTSDLTAAPAIPDEVDEPEPEPDYEDEPAWMPPADPRHDGLQPGEDFITAQTERFMKIELRRDKFPHVIGHLIPQYQQLQAMSIRQLDELIRMITFRIKARNSNMMVQMFANTGFAAIEALGPFAGLQLQGYAKVMSEDPTVRDLVNEIMLDYEKYISIDPKFRLAIAALATGRAVHEANSELGRIDAERVELKRPAPVDPRTVGDL